MSEREKESERLKIIIDGSIQMQIKFNIISFNCMVYENLLLHSKHLHIIYRGIIIIFIFLCISDHTQKLIKEDKQARSPTKNYFIF